MPVQNVPGFDLQPSAQRVPLESNYITNFDFLNQYLPDTYEKEFERYGNRTISSFLWLVCTSFRSHRLCAFARPARGSQVNSFF